MKLTFVSCEYLTKFKHCDVSCANHIRIDTERKVNSPVKRLKGIMTKHFRKKRKKKKKEQRS